MTDNEKKYFVQLPGYEQGEFWDEAKYERNRDKLMQDHPDAMVVSASTLGADEQINDKDNYTVYLPGYEQGEMWDAAKLSRNREQLLKDHPDAQISKVAAVDYWGDRLRETEDALNKAETEIATITSIDPKAGMRPSSGMFPMIPQDNSTAEERTRYRELSKQIETLRADRENNYAYKQQLAAKAKFFDEEEGRLEQMRKDMAKANPKAELHRQSYWEVTMPFTQRSFLMQK